MTKPRIVPIVTPYFNGELALDPHHYHNGLPALCLTDPEEGDAYTTASVNPNVPPSQVPQGCICLKGWSENEGIPAALQAAGIVGPPIAFIPSGFVTISVHKINPEYLALWGMKEAA